MIAYEDNLKKRKYNVPFITGRILSTLKNLILSSKKEKEKKKNNLTSACVFGIMLKTCMSSSLYCSFVMQRDGFVTQGAKWRALDHICKFSFGKTLLVR